MYQIFVRNFSPEGTFSAVQKRLDDIKSLGTDIIWLMPIHPIGVKNRKGSLGSPYAICDYRAVNPEFGTIGDLRALVDAIHGKGMKCIIDVVYNHTSPDSVLAKEHPEWFYHKADGAMGNRVGDWSDIIDLDYSSPELWDYQIETLKLWAGIVDGFRCDVAPMVPIAFWEKARAEVEKVHSGCIWLSESIDPHFMRYVRAHGISAHSDCEMYRAFDICYDYDVYFDLKAVFERKGTIESYIREVNRQEYIYPENYVKLCYLENHDQTRAAYHIPDKKRLRNWTAFMFFRKGLMLVYNGQENCAQHLPGLFDKDTVDFSGEDISAFIRTLADIKKDPVFTDSAYSVKVIEESVITAEHISGNKKAVGVFSVKGVTESIPVNLPDGIYTNLIDGKPVEVFRDLIISQGEPIIIITDKS